MFKKAVRDDLNFLLMLGLVCMLMLFGIILLVSENKNSDNVSSKNQSLKKSDQPITDPEQKTKPKNEKLPVRVSISSNTQKVLDDSEDIE